MGDLAESGGGGITIGVVLVQNELVAGGSGGEWCPGYQV